MLKKLFRLSWGRYHALNKVEVSASSLLYNYQYLLKKSGQHIFPVLKSNAYGHGIVHVAHILDSLGVPYFCVDSIYEAYQLMKVKIKTPILIMGYVHPQSLGVKKLPFSYAVYGNEMVEAIAKYQSHAKIHIFVDTGMHREGVPLHELQVFIKKCKTLHLKIEGLMSHMAMADKPIDKDTKAQVDNFFKSSGNPAWGRNCSSMDTFRCFILYPQSKEISRLDGKCCAGWNCTLWNRSYK